MEMIKPTEGHILNGLGLSDIQTPCTIIDLVALEKNAQVIERVRSATGVKILAALKAFALWKLFPVIAPYCDGTCASGPIEAQLGKDYFPGEVHVFSPGYSDEDMRMCAELSHHMVFNSVHQLHTFQRLSQQEGYADVSVGLRINPEYSEVETESYNPCAVGSRLGIRKRDLALKDMIGVDGLHFHTMCEQDSYTLERTLSIVEKKFAEYLDRCSWVNCGGGHHITNPAYDVDHLIAVLQAFQQRHPHVQIYLEPGEAIALGTGVLLATVQDVVQADIPVAILDVSATAHMPDVLEMPYSPDVWGTGGDWSCRLAGNSCLTGDVIGVYRFPAPLERGDKVVFGDMAHYTTVKTTTFNGVRLPSLATWDGQTFQLLNTFGYEAYRDRLS